MFKNRQEYLFSSNLFRLTAEQEQEKEEKFRFVAMHVSRKHISIKRDGRVASVNSPHDTRPTREIHRAAVQIPRSRIIINMTHSLRMTAVLPTREEVKEDGRNSGQFSHSDR